MLQKWLNQQRGAQKKCMNRFNLGDDQQMSDEEILKFVEDNCACSYCHELVYTCGIDRVDSQRGYILSNASAGIQGNCIRVCHTCNLQKTNFDYFYWISRMKKIFEYFSV